MQFVAVVAFLTITANFCLAQDTADGEVVLPNAEEVDEDFQKSLTTTRQRPKEGPSDEDFNRFAKQLESGDYDTFVQDRVKGDEAQVSSRDKLVASTDLKQVNLYVQSFQQSRLRFYDCCPQIQNYQCRENKEQLTVWYQWPYGWCYPINKVYRVTCNCRKCFAQCPNCIYEGKCLTKKRFQSFFAVCWNWRWAQIVHFNMYLSSSCYCSAHC